MHKSDPVEYLCFKFLWSKWCLIVNGGLYAAYFGHGTVKPPEIFRVKKYKVNFPFSNIKISKKVFIYPKGHPLLRASHRYTVAFDQNCGVYLFQESCQVKRGEKRHYLCHMDKELRLVRTYKQTGVPINRWRLGNETILLVYDKRIWVNRLKFRWLIMVRLRTTLKTIGMDMFSSTVVVSRIFNNSDAVLPVLRKAIYNAKMCFLKFGDDGTIFRFYLYFVKLLFVSCLRNFSIYF